MRCWKVERWGARMRGVWGWSILGMERRVEGEGEGVGDWCRLCRSCRCVGSRWDCTCRKRVDASPR